MFQIEFEVSAKELADGFNPLKSGQLFQIFQGIDLKPFVQAAFQSPKIGSVISNIPKVVSRPLAIWLFQSPKIGSVVSNMLVALGGIGASLALFQSPKIGSVVSNFKL